MTEPLESTGRDNVLANAVGNAGALGISPVRPAYQQVADQLLELILSGTLSSGDRLPSEAELTKIFGVSRSTIREALRVLASRDFIRTTRGTTGGTFVSRIEPDKVSDFLETSLGLMTGSEDISVADMLEAREILEVPAARLAAQRGDASHIAQLREAIDREVVSRGRGGKFAEHRNFHGLVVQATGNELLGLVTEPVFRVLQARFLDPSTPSTFWAHVDQDHEDILAAIESGDGEAAADAMRDHLIRLREAYRDAPGVRVAGID